MTPKTAFIIPQRATANRIARNVLAELAHIDNDTIDSGGIIAAIVYDALDARRIYEDSRDPSFANHPRGRHKTITAWRRCAPCQRVHRKFVALAVDAEAAFANDEQVVESLGAYIRAAIEKRGAAS